MVSITSYVRHLLSSDSVLYECRNCGETLENDQTSCPVCGATDVAEYEHLS